MLQMSWGSHVIQVAYVWGSMCQNACIHVCSCADFHFGLSQTLTCTLSWLPFPCSSFSCTLHPIIMATPQEEETASETNSYCNCTCMSSVLAPCNPDVHSMCMYWHACAYTLTYIPIKYIQYNGRCTVFDITTSFTGSVLVRDLMQTEPSMFWLGESEW